MYWTLLYVLEKRRLLYNIIYVNKVKTYSVIDRSVAIILPSSIGTNSESLTTSSWTIGFSGSSHVVWKKHLRNEKKMDWKWFIFVFWTNSQPTLNLPEVPFFRSIFFEKFQCHFFRWQFDAIWNLFVRESIVCIRNFGRFVNYRLPCQRVTVLVW